MPASLFLFAFLALFFIFPQNTNALATDTSSTNLRNVVGPIMQYVWDLIVQLFNGLMYLGVSSYILETAINYSPAWINSDPTRNAFIASGLNITTAMADIALIIVFIAVAIGYVFKIEGYNNQKVVIKFFISALLVHFAPMFVGMLIDISNIITSSIMAGKETIITSSFINFTKDIATSLGVLIGIYSTTAKALAVPEIGALSAAGIVLVFLPTMFAFLPNLIIQGMMLTTINGILFSYAMFFMTRIFVMQILVVLGPLAILAGVLDKTKKFYDMWMEWLLGWSFGGILMLFLLVLGLSASNILGATPPAARPLAGADWAINLYMERNFHWFALAIYMLTVEMICTGLIPALAGQVTEKFKAAGNKLGGMATKLDPYNKKLVKAGIKKGKPGEVEM